VFLLPCSRRPDARAQATLGGLAGGAAAVDSELAGDLGGERARALCSRQAAGGKAAHNTVRCGCRRAACGRPAVRRAGVHVQAAEQHRSNQQGRAESRRALEQSAGSRVECTECRQPSRVQAAGAQVARADVRRAGLRL
jgi:hypothetical protein